MRWTKSELGTRADHELLTVGLLGISGLAAMKPLSDFVGVHQYALDSRNMFIIMSLLFL